MTSRCLSPLVLIFDADDAAEDEFAPSGMIGFFNAAVAADDPACWEVGSGHHFHDLIDRVLRIIEIRGASLR